MKSFLRYLRAIDKQFKSKTPTSERLLFCKNAPREQRQSAGDKALAHQAYSFIVRTSLFTLSQLTLQTGLFLTGVMTAPAQTSVSDLTIAKSHSGSFSIGGIGIYTLTVANSGSAPSTGVITVTDTLPTALSVNNNLSGPIVVSGVNSADWFCTSDASTPQKITCTSSSIISNVAGSNTSSFNLSVQIKSTAPTGTNSITNTATVSGGGETNTTNNSSSDPTSISAAPILTCPTIYGGAYNSAANLYNQIRIYSSSGVPGSVIQTISDTRAIGITPLLDSNGRRRIYYVSVPSDGSKLRYFDGVNNVDTGITIPTATTVVRLAVNSFGIVHIMDSSPTLWRYNPTTNTLSSSITIADNPSNIETLASSSGGDIAFDAAGVMYVVAFDSPTTKFRLFRVDGLETGPPEATLLATNPTTLQTGAIAYDPSGQLLMITGGAPGSVFSWNLATGTISALPSANPGVFDLASCNFPNFLPILNATKTAVKVAGSAGSDVSPGDTIEYTIIVRNTGSIIAAGVNFADAIPTGTTYVPNSTTLNGTSVTDISGAMRYATPNLINSPGKVAGSLIVDTTPATLTDNEAVIKFRVKVNTTSPPSSVSNQGTVFYTGGPTAGIKTDDPSAAGSLDSTITPINQFPDTTVVSAPSQTNPGGTATVQVPNLSGSDPEEGSLGMGGSFKIVTLPSNGTLYYNGTPITSPNFVIPNYDPTKLTIDPNDGAITVSFTYAAIDSTGKEDPTPATVTMPFTNAISCPVGSTASGSGYATGGIGQYVTRNAIYWLDWSCGATTQFNPGDTVTKTWTAPNGISVTAIISNITKTLGTYTSGSYAGDRLQDLYEGPTSTGLSNRNYGEDPSYKVTFSMTLNGVPIPADIVSAEAESTDGPNEFASWTTDGDPWQPLEAAPRSSLKTTFSNGGKTIYMDDNPNGGFGVLVALAQNVSNITVNMNAGGKEAIAFGIMIPFDYGDAPATYGAASHYTRRLASGGSQPTTPTNVNSLTMATLSYNSPYLGAIGADPETANQPTVSADGDKLKGDNDEDAFTTLPNIPASGTYALNNIPVNNTSGNPGTLYAWVDFNRNGVFEASEFTSTTVANNATSVNLSWTIPSGTVTGTTYARFRLTTQPLTDNTGTPAVDERSIGVASDGEVEDYQVMLKWANVLLVKRITAINGVNLNTYKDNTTDSRAADDNSPNWPAPLNTNTALGDTSISSFLRGAIDAGEAKPGDTIEYTIYFLNAGNSDANGVRICDRILGVQQLNGTTIELQQNNTSPTSLTSVADGDRATFYPISSAATNCNFSSSPTTDNGAVVVDVTGVTGTPPWSVLTGSTGQGTPDSYGFVRFTTQVNP
jgi:uncharacterized repeat protein (TIGR01451 family)